MGGREACRDIKSENEVNFRETAYDMKARKRKKAGL